MPTQRSPLTICVPLRAVKVTLASHYAIRSGGGEDGAPASSLFVSSRIYDVLLTRRHRFILCASHVERAPNRGTFDTLTLRFSLYGRGRGEFHTLSLCLIHVYIAFHAVTVLDVQSIHVDRVVLVGAQLLPYVHAVRTLHAAATQ